MSSSDDDTKESVGLSDLSITLLCDSDVITLVDSDQVLSDVDLPLESVVNDKRQVIRIHDVSPDVLLVDDSQVGWAGDSHRPVMRIASGKRMPGKVSTATSRAPLSLDMTVKCTAGVATTAAQPSAVTSPPAIGTATITSKEAEISTGASDVAPVRRLEQDSVLVGEGVPAVAHSSPPLFVSPDPVPVVESGPPDVELTSSPSSGQSSSISSQTLAWEDAGDSSVPLSPNRVQEGLSQDVPDEGSLFNVSPISPGFLFRPSGANQQLMSDGLLLPTMLDDFNVSVLGAPITYARCEPIPGSDSHFLCRCTPCRRDPLLCRASRGFRLCWLRGPPPMDVEDGLLLETGLPGCPYRFTEYSGQPFLDGNPAFGLQLHHPRFLEFVRAPESARLLCWSPTFWVDELGRDPAMAATVNLQRDAGIMLSKFKYCHSSPRRYTVCHVIRIDGLGHRPDGISSG